MDGKSGGHSGESAVAVLAFLLAEFVAGAGVWEQSPCFRDVFNARNNRPTDDSTMNQQSVLSRLSLIPIHLVLTTMIPSGKKVTRPSQESGLVITD
jgi:hypothetical protein